MSFKGLFSQKQGEVKIGKAWAEHFDLQKKEKTFIF